jgi:hypothetical protein
LPDFVNLAKLALLVAFGCAFGDAVWDEVAFLRHGVLLVLDQFYVSHAGASLVFAIH